MYMTARGYEPLPDFGEALDAEDVRVAQNWHHIWHYTRLGFYHDQLQAYFNAFGRDRVRVHLFDGMRSEKSNMLRNIFDYLEIDASFQADTDSEINKSGKPKSKLLQSAMKMIGEVSWLREGIKSVVPLALRDKIRAANLRDEGMPEGCRERLINLYKPEIDRLSSLLKLDLSHWLSKSSSSNLE